MRKRLRDAAQSQLDPHHPGDFNQGVMELGATLCQPRDPQCLLCPVRDFCEAHRAGRQQDLPVKSKRAVQRKILRTVYIVERGGCLLLWQRGEDSAKLAGFWELPEAEHAPEARVGERVGAFRHTIVNHDYRFEVWRAEVVGTPVGCQWIDFETVRKAPLSTASRKALRLLVS
ncbi:MAG: NUDIX domain-containing protein [Acidobacteria bacterium]|nr:NUDIX domain-containing protein [Acidobacteriota bacterium]